jgi:DNA-binding HxlR family transcriptional regulator
MDKKNMAIAPTSELMERIDLSQKTIYKTLEVLRSTDYIRKRANSVYMVNPTYCAKVGGDDRVVLVNDYSLLGAVE